MREPRGEAVDGVSAVPIVLNRLKHLPARARAAGVRLAGYSACAHIARAPRFRREGGGGGAPWECRGFPVQRGLWEPAVRALREIHDAVRALREVHDSVREGGGVGVRGGGGGFDFRRVRLVREEGQGVSG